VSYRNEAEQFFAVRCERRARSCVEVEADNTPDANGTSFPQSVDLKPDETVFVGIMTFHSRAHRDAVHAKVMKDPRMATMDPKSKSFDAKRTFFGGFKPCAGEVAAAVTPVIQP
jgi:uncharacterized protein YbaA (DUF1428 family)